MKKSFMTRALATGLSFAMAFSLSAATNVTTASAAAKKASVTTFMKVASKSVTEGKKVTTYMNSTATKKYRIKSHTETATAKKYISVVMTSNRKGLTIEAKDGVLAQKNLTKKGVNVKINFAPATSVAAVKKAAATKYVNLKVVVNAKPVEKLTMTAAATAVKEITLTFNKAVADTTVAKITVKKGNATPTFTAKWADDKKSVVLAMDSKLTKGTYDVTVSGLEKEDLTASVTVEDQKLTAFELLSTNLVADKIPVSYGSIKFKAIDQYGKAMKADQVTVTSSFGKFGILSSSNVFTDKTNTTVSVKDSEPFTASFEITSALAILGTKGTITIVDGKTGVNLSSEITLVAPAQASKVECLGLYNTSKGKYMDMTAGDKVSDYVIALKFADQYGTEIGAGDVRNIQATMAAGTTNIASFVASSYDTMKINDKDVYILKLAASSGTEVKAGTMQVTLVNTGVGLLDTLNFTVAPGTVIKSFSVSADGDIYAKEENTLNYTAIDADGNEVTKYDVLNKAITTKDPYVSIKKQADGSAKLVYNLTTDVAGANTTDYKASESKVLTFMLYENSANIIVNNTTIKVNQARRFWEVTGIDSTKVTATASAALTYKVTDLKIADQYGNTLTADQIKNLISANAITVKATEGAGWTVNGNAVDTAVSITNTNDITVAPGTADTAKISFKALAVNSNDDGYTLTVSKVDATKATDFAIEWTDGIKTFNVSDGALDLSGTNANNGGKAYFSVVGKVGGKKVTIPTTQYTITGGQTQSKNSDGTKDRITKTATLTVVVDDNDHNSNTITSEYTYSNADSKLTTLKGKDSVTDITTTGALSKDNFASVAFELKDQYGKAMTASAIGDLTANVTVLEGTGVVKYNGTNKVEVDDKSATEKVTKISVTFTCGDLTATKEIKITR